MKSLIEEDDVKIERKAIKKERSASRSKKPKVENFDDDVVLISKKNVKLLSELGFSKSNIEKVLKQTKNNVEESIQILLNLQMGEEEK
jgi:Holliday junction resolvasome RuvABC DNA-binding subunit